ARIGVDPGLIRVGRSGAGVDVAPDLCVDPEAGQQRPEQYFVRLRIGGGEKIRNVMVTRRRERGLREPPRGDAVRLENGAVQRPLDDQRPLRRFGELHDPIRIRRLRGGERQSTPKADEVVRILRDVMLEARLAQRAGRELRVEGHRADDLVDGDVLVPGLAREETGSAHGDGVPETDRRAPRRVQNMVGPGDVAQASIVNGLRVKQFQKAPLNANAFLSRCQRRLSGGTETSAKTGWSNMPAKTTTHSKQAPAKIGRPTKYSLEWAEAFCEEL